MSENGLKRALERCRVSQRELAAELGVSEQTVWGWCNGHRTPRLENLVASVEYLQQFDPDLTVDDLLVAKTGETVS